MVLKWLQVFADGKTGIDPWKVRREALNENFRRGAIFSIFILIAGTIFAALDILAMVSITGTNHLNYTYLVYYILMLDTSMIFFAVAKTNQTQTEMSEKKIRQSEAIITAYIVITMSWASLLTLLNQALYGQPLAFMVIGIACPAFFIINWRCMIIPFAVSSAILLAGLPFYQKDPRILSAQYASLAVFIIASWLVSRMLYRAFIRDLASTAELVFAEKQLQEEQNRNIELSDKLDHATLQLTNLFLLDEQTGAASRKGLRNFIDQAFAQQERPVSHLGALMIDIDRFSQFNDSYGQTAGDEALAALARFLAAQAWLPLELVARWGGEEFVLVSFDREEEEIHELAESIRQQVENMAADGGLPGHLTVSIGTGFLPVEKPSDVGSVIGDADMAMYSAKRAGRNRIWSIPPRIRIVPVESIGQAAETAALAGKIWREHYASIISAEQIEYMLEKFQSTDAIWQDIEERGCQYDLISYQDNWAGYMAACHDDDKNACFLSKLYVDKMYRGNHLARRMLDNLIGRCRQRGYEKIWLTVNKQNESAIAAYRKMGFTKGKPVVTDIGGGYVMDDYIMTLTLEQTEE